MVATRAGRLREWSQGELRLYYSLLPIGIRISEFEKENEMNSGSCSQMTHHENGLLQKDLRQSVQRAMQRYNAMSLHVTSNVNDSSRDNGLQS